MKSCRSCGDHILWVVTTNGKPTPVNVKKVQVLVPTGNVIDTGRGSAQECELRTGYVSHFATCPDADRFRKTNP